MSDLLSIRGSGTEVGLLERIGDGLYGVRWQAWAGPLVASGHGVDADDAQRRADASLRELRRRTWELEAAHG